MPEILYRRSCESQKFRFTYLISPAKLIFPISLSCNVFSANHQHKKQRPLTLYLRQYQHVQKKPIMRVDIIMTTFYSFHLYYSFMWRRYNKRLTLLCFKMKKLQCSCFKEQTSDSSVRNVAPFHNLVPVQRRSPVTEHSLNLCSGLF